MILLHRRLAALLGLIALLAFISGAGLDAPSVIPAAVVLLFAVFRQPGQRSARYLEPLWRTAALVLAVRAGVRVFSRVGDPVLPMVDLLLLLLCAESVRPRDGSGDARHFALTFALLIASAAYRPGPLFGALFVAYVVCATVVLVVGHLAREAQQHGVNAPPPRPRFLLRVVLLSSVVLIVSGAVFLFFPRVSQGWAARATPPTARAMVGFSDRVSIGDHGTRIESNPEVVLRVEFPGGPPPNLRSLHWRGRSYHRFDGASWSRVERTGSRLREADVWTGPLLEQVIYARPLGEANVLFGMHAVLDVTPLSPIRPVRMAGGDYLYTGDVEPVYTVRSRTAPPDPDALRQVQPEHSVEALTNLQLPAVTPRMMRLADSLRLSATNTYDHAVAVERYLGTQFDYTLDLPPTRREATLDHFLFERRAGHCEYFSTAMAVLLRAGGVPTRNVNGFLGGEWNEFGQYLSVTQNNAHSWVEVLFPGYGWVTFDPTPPGAAAGIARGMGALGSLRMLLDGLDHRWSKWILDYDLGRQVSLLQRMSRPFTPRPEGTVQQATERRPVWLYAAGAALLAGLLLGLARVRSGGRPSRSVPSRIYVGMRRAYERAGFAPAHALPPLAFARAVLDAPGAADAQRAVDLYVRMRFSGAAVDAELLDELKQSAEAARLALRSQPRR
jgi:protein-glutamine gamma-glutamyltransferase